ncbi:MAG: hypothetical protein BA863_01700 [Desulfovibrio sp. S3730MH75]|nr:MAG: hypothetical protein BA863_01700 [Desulfovibrio sp. S3730MH75]
MNSKYVSPFPTLNFPSLASTNKPNNLVHEAHHEDMNWWLDSSREDEFKNCPHINIYSGSSCFLDQKLKKLHTESPIARLDETAGESSRTEHWEDYDNVVVLAEHPYLLYASSTTNNKIPIGFIQFNLSIRYYDFEKTISVICNIERIYAAKKNRCQHVGAALIFATAEVVQKHCEDILSQCNIMPKSYPTIEALEITLYAELHSKEGENMLLLLNSKLELFKDDFEMENEGGKVRIKGIELDVGF